MGQNLNINTGMICGRIETSHGAVKRRKDKSCAMSAQDEINQIIFFKKMDAKEYSHNLETWNFAYGCF